jgi:general L-amino acid transport system substrate-binding protein
LLLAVGAIACQALLSGCVRPGSGSTLAEIRARGRLVCGVNDTLPGFGLRGKDGSYSGFDVDYCRALAAAVLGDDRKVTYQPLSARERFKALADGKVDVLIRNTTWTLSRDAAGFDFGPPTFYDGQGFLVRGDSKIVELNHLAGKRICVILGTTSEANLRDAMARLKIAFTAVPAADLAAMGKRYDARECDAVTGDRSALLALLSTGGPERGDQVILGPTISKEPMGPMLRHGDPAWVDVVRWVVFATFEAEELGLTSGTVAEARAKSPNGQQRRLLGVEEDLGARLGLPRDWAYQVVLRVGSYGEIYDRNFGPTTATPIPRWINKPWMEGGVLFAPPFR